MDAGDRSNCNLHQTRIQAGATRSQLDLHDLATHLLDALLFFEPVLVGNQLREKGVLQFALRPNTSLARNASRNLKHSHGEKPS
jgi:hypothetical protein